MMEIGIDSFAAILPDPATGKLPSATDRLAGLLEEAEVADRAGLDVFGIGEHHRAVFPDSAPAIILAAAGARTSTIRILRRQHRPHRQRSADLRNPSLAFHLRRHRWTNHEATPTSLTCRSDLSDMCDLVIPTIANGTLYATP
jgi:hypothetical protein